MAYYVKNGIDKGIELLPTPERIFLGRGENAYMVNWLPSGFDIETYTQYTKDNTGKVTSHYTNMYIWTFTICDITYIGRTWDEFSDMIKSIEKHFCKKNGKVRFLSFICNQSFEFAFMGRELYSRGHHVEVFAREKRKPMKITIDNCVTFFDSFKITGFSLKKMAENYCKTQKLVGDLDYTIPRNKYTELDEKTELQYCINDTVILKEYAEYYRENYMPESEKMGNNSTIPMTQTMRANRIMKDKIAETNASKDIYNLMKKCYPKTKQQYDYIMLFFSGAYTHGMLCNLFVEKENQLAFDETSEYPYCMFFKYFPVSKFKKLYTPEKIDYIIKNKCCLIDCTITNVKTKYGVTVFSKHKVTECINPIWDNGRLYSCDSVRLFITEIDLEILKMHYDFDENITYNNITYADRGLLPQYVRLTLADLYVKKSKLKGVVGKEIEYMESKQGLNGQYGAFCVKEHFVNDVFVDGEWIKEPNNIDFSKLFTHKQRLPQWAVWVTAHARYNILSMVEKICKVNPKDYTYSDTDSIKCANKPYILKIFDDENKRIIAENKTLCDKLGISKMYPDTDFTVLGTWDREHDIKRMKCLGSKRYITETDKGIETTVAGLPKKAYLEYCDKHNKDYFDTFDIDGIMISDLESEKLCAYYMDKPQDFCVTDLQGHTEEIHTESYVSLIPTSFSLKIDGDLTELYFRECVAEQQALAL